MRFSFSFFSLFYMDSHLWSWQQSSITTSIIDPLPALVSSTLLVLSIIYLLYHRQANHPFDLKQNVLQQQEDDHDEYVCHQQQQHHGSKYCKHLQLFLSSIVAFGWLCCMMMVDVYAAVYFVIWASVVCI